MATFGLQMTALRKEQGRLGEMEATQKAFAQQYPLAGTGLALTYAQLGREAEARDAFERLAANGFADLPRDFAWMACVTNLAETCAFLHDAQRAATLYELLLPYAERTVVVGYAHTCFGSVSLHLGLLAATMSRWDEAVQHFEYALEMNTRLGARPYLAHTQHGYARMLIDRDASGDRDKAFRLLTEAVAMYGEIGMPKHVEMAERMLGEV
jgi:tetratricopeptide (TPR) repeat protein